MYEATAGGDCNSGALASAVDAIMAEADQDRNGKIDFAEFMQYAVENRRDAAVRLLPMMTAFDFVAGFQNSFVSEMRGSGGGHSSSSSSSSSSPSPESPKAVTLFEDYLAGEDNVSACCSYCHAPLGKSQGTTMYGFVYCSAEGSCMREHRRTEEFILAKRRLDDVSLSLADYNYQPATFDGSPNPPRAPRPSHGPSQSERLSMFIRAWDALHE